MASVTYQSKQELAAETRGVSAYAAEFLGTLLLVFFIGAAASTNSKAGLGYTDFALIGLVHAFGLTILIASFGRFSGGHFNPAVTIAVAALKKIRPADAVVYIVVQLLGAVVAALLLKVAFTTDVETVANFGAATPVKELVSGKDGIGGGFIFEFIGVFALVLAVVATAIAPGGDRRFAPIIIGSTLGVAFFVTGPVTGGALNPARAFGPALIGNSWAGGAVPYLVVYVLAPVLAGIVAAITYNVLLGDESKRETSPLETFNEEETTRG